MTSTADCDPLVKGVDDVLITDELANRPSRAPDYEVESRALGRLAQELAANPRGVLQKCAELVVELCHADSAGISILEPGGASGLLRWHAAAGGFAPNLHGTMPREASPCGTVMERDCVLLFHEAERFFPALRGVEPRIYENLLAPWHVKGKAVGTLWAIRHVPEGRFDGEDARILQSLARFAAAAFQMTLALDEAIAERSAIRASEQQLRDVLDSMTEGFVLLDADFTVRDVNAETLRLDGRTRDELVGRKLWEAFAGSEDSPQGTMFKRVMRDRTPEAMEHSYSWPGGKTMWLDTRAYPTTHGRTGILWRDITSRKQSEQELRESEERQAFLLNLSDTVRSLADPAGIQGATTRLLRDQFNAGWCYYVHWDLNRKTGVVLRDSAREGLPSLAGAHDVSDAPEFLQLLADGAVRTVRDYTGYEQLPARIRQNFVSLGFRSMMMAPLVKEGRVIASLLVGDTDVRDWSASEASLLAEVAERTWAAIERARAEAALRESEERFRQFANASAAGLWIRDADTLAMEFVSPAVGAIYGVDAEALLGDVTRWAAMIVPEDRDAALGHLEEARRGEVAVHEFRIQRPSDSAFRWIRNTDFPLRDNGHVPRIGGIAEDVTEAKLAAEHSAVLLAELQHRVRNIMALLRSITNRTGERAESVPDYRDLMMGRLLAFARVQALLNPGRQRQRRHRLHRSGRSQRAGETREPVRLRRS